MDAHKDIVETGLPAIIECRRSGIGAGEAIPCGQVRKIECGIFCDHFVICSREARVLMGHIGFGADERLNAGIAEEAVEVVIVAQEVLRHTAILKVPPKLRPDRLKLLDQCVAGFAAWHVKRPAVGEIRKITRRRLVIGPRTDQAWPIGCDLIKTSLQQNPILDALR